MGRASGPSPSDLSFGSRAERGKKNCLRTEIAKDNLAESVPNNSPPKEVSTAAIASLITDVFQWRKGKERKPLFAIKPEWLQIIMRD